MPDDLAATDASVEDAATAAPPVGEPKPPKPADEAEAERLRKHNAKVIQEKRSVENKYAEMLKQSGQKDEYIAVLESKLQEREAEISSLSAENASLKEAKIKSDQQRTEQSKAHAFLSAVSTAVVKPDQFYKLVQDRVTQHDDGSLTVLSGGVELSINDFIEQCKAPNSEFEHHMAAPGGRGMGAPVGAATAVDGQQNPYLLGSRGLTQRIMLEETDPQRAAMLEQQARAMLAAQNRR